ncbi:MAG: urease accessory UreF family protein [Polyangiales bacterium]
MTPSFLVLQLADAAFPAGGFAHSAGLEAAMQAGLLDDARSSGSIARFVDESIRQCAAFALPFVRAAHRDPPRLASLDALCDAMLSNHVANRASRAQGRALLEACARTFEGEVVTLREALYARQAPIHQAPLFGALMAPLGLDEDATARVFAHSAARGVISAAVRLGAVGALEGQRLQLGVHRTLEAAIVDSRAARVDDAAQISPIVDLLQSTHDRLYSRLFQS